MKAILGIRLRLWMAVALPVLSVVVMLMVGLVERYESELMSAWQQRAEAAARQLGTVTEFDVLSMNVDALQRHVNSVMRADSDVRMVGVYGSDGAKLAEAGQSLLGLVEFNRYLVRFSRNQLLVVMPIEVSPTPVSDPFLESRRMSSDLMEKPLFLGYVVIEFDLEKRYFQRQSFWLSVAMITVIGLLFAGILSLWMVSKVTEPIEHIVSVVLQLREGNLDARVDEKRSGLLEPLGQGINEMAVQVGLTQEQLRTRIEQATQELRTQKNAAEQAARIDPLTGVGSRRALLQAAEMGIQEGLRNGGEMVMVLIDLDFFKQINDNYGHSAGDAVLVSFAHTLQAMVREQDVFGRLGGEEFAILLFGTGLADAQGVADRMRQAIANSPLTVRGHRLKYTASFGLAAFDANRPLFEDWLDRADQALYQAKHQGRNRVEVYQDPMSVRSPATVS